MDVQRHCVELENVMMIQLQPAPVTGSMRGKKNTISLELFITFHYGFIKKPELLCDCKLSEPSSHLASRVNEK